MGNGHDTLLLAENVGETGKVYSFDIQDLALENTRKKLEEHGLLDRVKLIKDSHTNFKEYINKTVDMIVYNLGYLPGSNKEIITKVETTYESIKIALEIIKPNGLILITSYIGHEGGLEENEKINELLYKLDQRKFNVSEIKFINQKKNPPILYIIEKSGER